MEREELSEIEAYPFGLSSRSDQFTAPRLQEYTCKKPEWI